MAVFGVSASYLFFTMFVLLHTVVGGSEDRADDLVIKYVTRRVSSDRDRVTLIVDFFFSTTTSARPQVKWERPGHTAAVLDTVLEMADLVERGMGVAALRLQGSEIEANENKGVTVRLGQLSGQYFEMALRVERTNKTTYVISRQARVIPQLDIGYSHGSDCEVTIKRVSGMNYRTPPSTDIRLEGAWVDETGQFYRGTPPENVLSISKLEERYSSQKWPRISHRLTFKTTRYAISGFFSVALQTDQLDQYQVDTPVVANIEDIMVIKVYKDIYKGPFPDDFIDVQLAPGAEGEKNCYVQYFDCQLLCVAAANKIENITINKAGGDSSNGTASSAVLVDRTPFGANAVLHIPLDTDFGGTYECVVTTNGTNTTDTVQLNKKTERFLYLFRESLK